MPDTAPKKVFTHREILVILSGLMTGMLLAALDQTIVSTALKSIVEDFNGLSHYTWVVTAYLLTSAAPILALDALLMLTLKELPMRHAGEQAPAPTLE